MNDAPLHAIYTGNALRDGTETRGWIVGSFLPPEAGLRHSKDVELKWGSHRADQARLEWVTSEERTTVCVLIAGRFEIEFSDHTVVLERQGDYVMWGHGVNHRWRATEDSTTLTIRWPSITEY